MRRLSLRARLTLVFAFAMACVLVAMAAFVFVRVHSELTATVDQNLEAQLPDAARSEFGIDPDSETIGQLLDANGLVVRGFQPAAISPAQLREVLAGHELHADATLAGREHRWRIVAAPAGGGAVVVAQSLHETDETLGHLFTELAFAIPFALVLASIGGYLLAGAALRPVEAMRRRAQSISAETPGARLPVPPRDDEIARLGVTLNEMLARIEAAVEHERRFVADASHELRTPLALLKTELDLALRRPRTPAELEQALRSAAVETDRLTQIAEDLLLLARSQDGALTLQRRPLAVGELFDEVARRYAARAERLGRRIEVEAGDRLRVDGDPLRLEQALHNLVDNALNHGAGTVRIEARPAGDRIELHVRDEGGFPPQFLERAFERFSRADEARGRGGTGLGLAIVELIAAAHGGEARAANTGGGADVWLSVPAARATALSHAPLIAGS